MITDLSFYELRALLFSREQERTAIFKIAELEAIWFCTKRNVIRKLRKMETLGFLTYYPGKGRGNPSRVTFPESFQEQVAAFCCHCNESNKQEQLLQLLQLPIPKHWILTSAASEKLFGIQQIGELDTLRATFTREITTLDPARSSITLESHLIEQLGDTLVKYDQDRDQIIPHLAHHWKVTEDFSVWTFFLRKGVYFHHMKEMTAEDVMYTFSRFEKDSPLHWMITEIAEIKKISSLVVEIKLHAPNPFFIRYLASNNLVILPHDIAFDEQKWIGTGAFMLKDRSTAKLILEVFPSYFHTRPFLDRIELWQIKRGEQEIHYQLLESDETQPRLLEEMENGIRFLGFNFNRASIIQDKYFRKTIYHLFDMDELHADLGEGMLKHASSYFPAKSKTPQKSMAKAAAFLKRSAYRGETVSIGAMRHKEAVDQAIWLQEKAKTIGLQLEVELFDLEDLYQQNGFDHLDMALFGEVADEDLELSFVGAFRNEALLFRKYFGEKHLQKIDQLLLRFTLGADKTARSLIADEIESYIHKEQLIVFLYHPVKQRVHTPFLQDMHLSGFGHPDFKRLWIDRQ